MSKVSKLFVSSFCSLLFTTVGCDREKSHGPTNNEDSVTGVINENFPKISTVGNVFAPESEITVNFKYLSGENGEGIEIVSAPSDQKSEQGPGKFGQKSGSIKLKTPSSSGNYAVVAKDAEGKIIISGETFKVLQLICEDKVSLKINGECVPTVPVYRWVKSSNWDKGQEFLTHKAGPKCAALKPEEREVPSDEPRNIVGKLPHPDCIEWLKGYELAGAVFRTVILDKGTSDTPGFIKLYRAFNGHIWSTPKQSNEVSNGDFPRFFPEGHHLMFPPGTANTQPLKSYFSKEKGYIYRLGDDTSDMPADSELFKIEAAYRRMLYTVISNGHIGISLPKDRQIKSESPHDE